MSERVVTESGIVIIPISKVCFGFAAGGSEFSGETMTGYKKYEKEETVEYKLPFGGGSGGTVSIHPVAFVTISGDTVKINPIEHASVLDKLIKANAKLRNNIGAITVSAIKYTNGEADEATVKIGHDWKIISNDTEGSGAADKANGHGGSAT